MAARVLAWSWAVVLMARSGFFPLVTAQSHQNMLKTRGERANLPHDPNTTSDCMYWVDVLGSTSCQDVMDEWDLTLDMMTRWNPSLSIGTGNTCQGWRHYVSYCIEAYHEPDTMTTTTTTKMAATKTASMPTSSPSAAGPSSSATWMERGCYIDSYPPTLAEQVLAPSGESGMTVNACQAACWTRGYVFAGVEAAESCYCGNSIRNELAPDASSTCTMACSGNSTQVCGGLNRIIIYEAAPVRTSTSAISTISATTSFAATISSSPTSIAVPKPTETWTPLGCYEDTA